MVGFIYNKATLYLTKLYYCLCWSLYCVTHFTNFVSLYNILYLTNETLNLNISK